MPGRLSEACRADRMHPVVCADRPMPGSPAGCSTGHDPRPDPGASGRRRAMSGIGANDARRRAERRYLAPGRRGRAPRAAAQGRPRHDRRGRRPCRPPPTPGAPRAVPGPGTQGALGDHGTAQAAFNARCPPEGGRKVPFVRPVVPGPQPTGGRARTRRRVRGASGRIRHLRAGPGRGRRACGQGRRAGSAPPGAPPRTCGSCPWRRGTLPA